MAPTVRPDGQHTPAHLPRRALVAGAAWTVPVVAAATAAPAFAASPCQLDFTYVLDWGSTSSPFVKTSATAGSAPASSTTAGGQAATVGFSTALIGAANGYTLDPTYNLTVPGPSGGGAAPNVTDLGDLGGATGAERGLCLQHSTSTTATVNATSGLPDRGQRLTITFPRQVTNLSFYLVDIDSTLTGYWDRIRFTTAAPSISNASTNINGNGFGTSPLRYGTAVSNSNVDENTSGARVKVTFAGPINSLVMEYWNASYSSGSSIQRVFLSDMTFTAKGC